MAMNSRSHKNERNYKLEYKNYQGKPEQIANRAQRNSARAQLMKEGLVKKGDGNDVNHKEALIKGGSNSRSNLNVVDANENRSYPRTRRARMK